MTSVGVGFWCLCAPVPGLRALVGPSAQSDPVLGKRCSPAISQVTKPEVLVKRLGRDSDPVFRESSRDHLRTLIISTPVTAEVGYR